jgi:DNA-binding winged helix-turn-helix (wHTH) protein/tetratricopeptide (TPR) repeat protein
LIYAFGEFELDEALLELRFRGCAQLVPPRVLKAMLHLIRHRTRAVSRDELAEVVWGGLAVSDAALSQAIMVARKITQDEGDQQRVIKTVRGYGFRFAAPVTERAQHTGPGLLTRGTARFDAPPPTSLAPARPTSLLGRDRELAELLAQLAHAEQGRGSLVFLEGEPGIGKTSLLDQLCVGASERGAQTFWGRCWEEGGAPAFWPFIQVLRAMLARFGADALRSWLDGEELLTLLPELAQKPLARAPASLVPLGSAQERFRVFDAMGRMLRRMAHALRDASNDAGPRTLLIALEDLHAADDASLQLLRFLTPDLRDAPLLLVATFRDLEVTPQGPLAALLGGPLENTRRLALSRLERHDVAMLVERLAGQAVAEPTVELLYQLSGGNPFLITELARCSKQELELSALSMLQMPERVARAVRRRTDGLPEPARSLVEVAAVVGHEVALAWLTRILDCTDQTLLAALEPALRTNILETAANSGGTRVRFSHALVRDMLYMELPLARRVSLHRRIGEALEASHGPDQLPLYELAHHFYLAVPEVGAPKAIDYALRAASQAEQAFAFDSAAALRDRAIDLSALPAADARLYELLLSAGSAWYRAGELDKACARFHRAAEHAGARTDGTRLALAVLSYARVRRALIVYDAQGVALIGPALAALGAGDTVLKASLLSYRSLTLDSFGSVAERDAATREAVEMARRLGNEPALMAALTLRRWLMSCALHPAQTRAIATELIALARAAGRSEPLLEGLFWRIQDHLELGDFAGAERDLVEYSALAESRRHMAHRYWALLLTAMMRTWCGRLAEAAEVVERARSLGQRIREPTASVLHAVQLWNIRVLQGAVAEAPEGLGLVFPGVAESYAARAFWLQIRVAEGRHEEARRLYDELARNDFADVPSDPFRRNVLACLSAGCVAFDDAARAAPLYELLVPDADVNVVVNWAWAFVGPVSRSLAHLALCMRDYERAALHFERALDQCAKSGARPLLATVQYEYAHTLERIPGARTGHAAQLLAAASQAAQELGIARSWPLAPALARTIHEGES